MHDGSSLTGAIIPGQVIGQEWIGREEIGLGGWPCLGGGDGR